ncbi:IS1182 family transposase [Desulfomarina profundi]|uniref:IS1182 family transposase n=2 Tax=Desulfomarina profundi TaxID=2772557 RepID=A0A8D5FU69_9BACT|nr:transposase [Desulfomarina profundi]BCL59957.1 IS1182 family transposase [Desulfomarina profundi]BCL61582.1 IS1182 family transposase [Desulfomarina profundi]BCL61589.1 IS1182 family transposase [Desulfomarina profundi]BCL63044.1 IS1182 family transposase [Desulfomarina profundi]BCL63054.1 IS1182 family transposase [Desulfomarina profundi]
MARYKPYSYAQGKFIPIHFANQILPGTFEYTLNYLIDHELDLSIFNDRYHNDDSGAPAYDPKILLKIILFAYSRGIVSSRKIERACRENVIFMALSADSRPHFTTIADFISSMDKEIVSLFLEVLLVCDEQKLIGREMFAIDGCKMPSNASVTWSGTRADFQKKVTKMETAIANMVNHHHMNDQEKSDENIKEKKEKYVKSLRKNIKKVRKWLDNNDDRRGKGKRPVKSNITDNESAKMKTSKGVIQGYNGVTAVDSKTQVIVAAEAYGQGSEQDLLEPMIDKISENLQETGKDNDVFKDAKLLADSGYHANKNMEMLAEKEIDAYVADNQFRKRDPRFKDYGRYKDRTRKERAKREGRKNLFVPADFTFPEDLSYCICPAGKRLYRSGGNIFTKGHHSVRFQAPQSACVPCKLRSKCLRYPDRTKTRQVAYFTGRMDKKKKTSCAEKMKRKIDSAAGRAIYSMRLAIGEPPFAHIRSTIGLNRFTLRSKKKVNIQWNLFCIIHNLKKVHAYGMGFV